jgi:hypothetical protein
MLVVDGFMEVTGMLSAILNKANVVMMWCWEEDGNENDATWEEPTIYQ